MHPALIPELHPLCGKYMEALVACRKENVYRKYFGACSHHTWDLSACLKEEKKIVREPRQKRYHELYAEKKQADQERMEQLRAQKSNLSDPAPGEQAPASAVGVDAEQ